MAGYSGTPLAKKLGIKPGARVLAVRAPDDFPGLLDPLPEGARLLKRAGAELDVVVLFACSRSEVERRFAKLAAALAPAGSLWVAWPKKSSGVSTDLAFDVVQGIGLGAGLVDTKICAIDDTWSGLRFVIRVADRHRRKS